MTTQNQQHRSPAWMLLVRVLAPVAAFLVVGFTVVGATRAAFSGTTDNTSNTFAAGTVVITDDDSGSAMFTASGMKPSDSVTECIAVSYDGSIVPADVKLYVASGGLAGTNLDDYLTLTIEEGTGGAFGDCTGFTGSQISTGTMDAFAA
ncbi:MAG: TasA family protein, partial [Acidimicrobiia bacterium]|nr:TasA family protein [Acidimicrobiia bacterium]